MGSIHKCLLLIGQVLTQEDWNTVLYNGMETTSSWASLYFIALMTLGNYVLFNLLVAILVEGFSTEVKKKSLEQRQFSAAKGHDLNLAII